jgi:two-component system, sensor histidine kinase PdtaS
MHKLLQRQILRAFGGSPPDSPQLLELLRTVDEAYAAADDDRLMLERSLEITSQIMLKKNEELRHARDVAEKAKDKVERADHEKALLLQEIHHRVKNNLQVIVSLLNLEANAKGHEGFRSYINEATGRIMSMATVHEILYESGDFSSIDFSTYLERIAKNAARASNVESNLVFRLEPIVIALDLAIPCGLILNEALTNSFKYGKGGDGTVRLSILLAREGSKIVVEVADSGPGFPPGFAMAEGRGLGCALMASLAGQIEGDVSFENEDGAHVRLALDLKRVHA